MSASSFVPVAAIPWRPALLPALWLGFIAAPPAALEVRAVVFEAESLVEKPDDTDACVWIGRGYAFIQPANAVGGWVDVQAKELLAGAFELRTEAVGLTVPPNLLAAGDYRVALRLLRWTATPEQEPVEKLSIEIGGAAFDHAFAGTDDPPLHFRGGCFHGEATWRWLELPAPVRVKAGPTQIYLQVTGGTGNYLGVFVDAVRFAPIETPKRALEITGWQGAIMPAVSPIPLPGADRCLLMARDRPERAGLKTAQHVPVAAETARVLAGWIRLETAVRRVTATFHDGVRRSAPVPLSKLVKAQPLQPGQWYLALLPSDQPEFQSLDRRQPWRIEWQAEPLGDEVRLAASDFTWRTEGEIRKWKETAERREWPLIVQREIRVATQLAELKPQPIAASKPVIIWPALRGAAGGTADLRVTRDHLDALKRDGIGGILCCVNLHRNARTRYVPDTVFTAERLAWEDFREPVADAQQTDWGGLTESFLRINVVDGEKQASAGLDWFDDAAWNATAEKIRWHARLAKQADIRGIFLDTEEYPPCAIFQYQRQVHAATRSWPEYARQATQRGRQIAQVCREEYPGLTLMLTYTGSERLPARFGAVKRRLAPADQAENLLYPFVDGLLAVDGLTVVDGFEGAYYNRTAREFIQHAWLMEQAADAHPDPPRYRARMKKGMGLYLSHQWNAENPDRSYFSAANLEHALHYALRFSDYSVWLYTETVDFWRDSGLDPASLCPHPLPPAHDRAIVAARQPHDLLRLPPSDETPGK